MAVALLGALLTSAGATSSPLETSLDYLMGKVKANVVAVEAYHPAFAAGKPPADALDPGGAPSDYRLSISSGVLLEGGREVVTIGSGVEGSDSVAVRLASGKRIQARLRGHDPILNVALVELAEAAPWTAPPALPLGPPKESLLERKAWVAALGYSSGDVDPLLTVGRLMGLSYTRAGSRTLALLRTTAPIFAGSSGGILVDMEGRWVGLLSGACVLESEAGLSQERMLLGGRPQAALALPVDEVLSCVTELRAQSNWDGAFLGVRVHRDSTGSQAGAGVTVVEVLNQCAAHRAGLAEGDRILKLDGVAIEEAASLTGLLAGRRPGDEVMVEVLRDGEIQIKRLELGSRLRFERQVEAAEREKLQQKQVRAQIRRLEAMLSRLQKSLATAPSPADAAPRHASSSP